ncbi:ABC transporter ATP-binding protein/permease [Streptomyces scopuliridis]|uniref:ABC transporter ATP-binding protein/permease n=1 Tax=Streptomyces scopuliridis TaxID=452529 RepID=A0ACD4ZV56_9ACTN|nr:ABC transporter ATP-binding protein [Streptomyces scopuliridis]WSC01692.1 ABC transporter ATP-binding protein/permease [Streptomyces scopuliridis]WSC04769.1 ABC transporter ATP-binding protein/permease [Streptomyces scopuliridis]
MNDPTIGASPTVPHPRTAPLPLPPASAPPAPEGAELGDELTDAYWATWDGEASRTSMWRIVGRLPAISRRVLQMAWRADARATLAVIVLQLGSAVMAAFGLLASIGVLQALFAQGATPDRIRAAVPSLALVAGLLMFRAVLDAGVALYQARLTPKIRRIVEMDFLHLTAHVRLEAVDDANWADDSSRANDRGLYYARQSITQIIELASAMLGLIGAASVLTVVHPLLLPLLLASVIPQGLASVRSARMRFLSQVRYSTLQRRIRLFTWLLLDRTAAAELRSSTAQPALLGEHERIARRIEEEDTRLGRAEAGTALAGRAIGGLATGLTYAALALMTMAGWLPLASGGGAVLAIRASQGTLTRIVLATHYVYEHALWVDDLLTFLAKCRTLLPRRTGRSAPGKVKTITVDHVEYTYPDGKKPALNGVSMELTAGSTVAFVGANGSGKSTMSKLLAGLYEPTAGTISWDGTDVLELDAESVQAQVAMVLQDPVEWPLSALANITISTGTITEADPERAHRAATASGADRVIAGLPQQWTTPLSKRFKDGEELSGGNWAKFAVARGLYKDAAVLLLDEPTASMDPRAEHAAYTAVLRGHHRTDRITILISHRLASVIECDQIFVFQDGRIIENGDHTSLMEQNGEYAQMFTLQAAAYQTDTPSRKGECG